MPQELSDKRVTIMGLGRFGGGIGVTRFLADAGARIIVTDRQSDAQLREPLAEIEDLLAGGRVELHLGEHSEQDFTAADFVVANPAVPQPWANPFLRSAIDAGVPVTTEIRLLVERIDRSRVIGVTGTAGKSTTTVMIHCALTGAGVRAHAGGNLGGSLLTNLAEIAPEDWIVLELSSAMLYWLGAGVGFADAPGWSPACAVLTNLHPNHFDWHGTMEHYEASKHNIFRYQQPGDTRFTEQDGDARGAISLCIPGSHNERNARLAVAVAAAAGVSPDDAARALATFRGLPHRLELVAEHGGLRFYNDSKSTTPQATELAVAAFPEPSHVHLIAGGYDKRIDLSAIADLGPRLAGLYGIGTTGAGLVGGAVGGHSEDCGTLDRAVEAALTCMKPGDVLLLSPGCASWDQFENFEQRGAVFVEAVTRLSGLRVG